MNIPALLKSYIACILGCFIFSCAAHSESVTTIINNGNPENRVDVVVLGDGYTSGQLTNFASDVTNFVTNQFFSEPPFSNYRNYFNLHRIDVVSNETGADHPEIGSMKNTALGANYNCTGIQRLLCIDNNAVSAVLNRSVSPSQRDIVIILVNDTEYGGAGGVYATSSVNSLAATIVLHEIGHSFGLLADEYSDSPPACNNTTEPPQPNITRVTDRNLVKWNTGGGPPAGWIDISTAIPTITSSAIPGLYEGARFCVTGLYRPTFNSKMRSNNAPFGPINEEQLIKRIYNLVSPIDTVAPTSTTVYARHGDSVPFVVGPMVPQTPLIQISWQVNNVELATGLNYNLNSTGLASGAYPVRVIVHDKTTKVRHDPQNILRDEFSWSLIVYDNPTSDTDTDAITDDIDTDDDNDGIADTYEVSNSLNPLVNDSTSDKDSDGISNLAEFQLGTSANNRDTDGDGVDDRTEQLSGRDPLLNDNSDLIVTKTVNFQTPVPASPVEFQVTVKNNGPRPASNIVVTDLMPTGMKTPSGLAPFFSQGDLLPIGIPV